MNEYMMKVTRSHKGPVNTRVPHDKKPWTDPIIKNPLFFEVKDDDAAWTMAHCHPEVNSIFDPKLKEYGGHEFQLWKRNKKGDWILLKEEE